MATTAQRTADGHRRDGAIGHIAVIGMACRFPGARDPEEFWRNLLDGRDSVTRVTGTDGVAARGLLDDPEWFDAGYFGISPREARIIDPQHRIFLECAVEALEDAGHDPARCPGAIGVYAGAGENAYAQLVKAERARPAPVSDWEIRVANSPAFLCSRVAHRLGLRGPAVTVQAACATSLVAVHLAVRGLLNGECDLALAGGVAVRVPSTRNSPDTVGIQAPDGVCRAFDADARGLVGGDGAGVVVLKRLSEAVADGDRVDAVIRGSAVNNDGGGSIGFTAPGIDGQAAVIEAAHRAAGVDARSCTYVEAHGTGTPLGDPVEIAALTRAFRRTTGERGFCGIGSVKTNIGHTDAAAGVAGLIKTVLAVKRGVIPPSLHFTTPNPQIDFGTSPFRVVTRALAWESQGAPRRAGVSSFGLGGTNAHVVVEEARRPAESGPGPRTWQLLPLSAKSPAALAAATDRLAEHLRRDPGLPLADVAWTLQCGRREHAYRRFALADGSADAVRILAGEQPDGLVTAPSRTGPRTVVFRFPARDSSAAHGSWGRLYATEPVFRGAADECLAGAAAPAVFLASADRKSGSGGAAPEADVSSAALTAFAGAYACARLWSHWGVEPAAVAGEGAGALVAATLAGVFAPADAARLVVAAREPGSAPLEELVRRTGPRPPAIPLRTAFGAKRTSPDQATDPAYWAACLRRAPRHGDTAQEPPDDPHHLVLDITTATVPESEQAVLRALGNLWLSGAPIDWAAVHRGRRPRRVALPTYPFERQRLVVEADEPSPRHDASAHVPEAAVRPADAATLDLVSALLAETLGLPDVEPDDSFFDLGGDSLIATRFMARVRELFPVDLAPRVLLDAPTAAALAALIDHHVATGSTR